MRSRRHPRATRGFACALFSGLMCVSAAQAQSLSIELNRADSRDEGCIAAFEIQNGTGQALDRFNIDLYVFDAAGVLSDRLLVDLAPLRAGKTRIAAFPLSQDGCPSIGRLLVNDIPTCRAEATQEQMDCLDGLSVSSKASISLSK